MMSDETHRPNSGSVEAWLAAVGLPQYAEAFASNDVDRDMLPSLSDSDLRDLGVESLGHRRRLLQAIHTMAEPATTAEPRVAAPGVRPLKIPVSAKPLVIPKPLAAREAAAATPFAPAEEAPASPPGGAPTAPRQPASVPAHPGEELLPRRAARSTRWWANRAILLSIALHLVFGVGATYFVVQHIQAKRKLTFQGGPPTPNPSTRALEHKINMARKQQTMSAPMQAKRIVTTGLAKVSLPDMPSMPSMSNDIVPGKMAGQGGTGVGLGPVGGMGGGMGAGGAGGSVPLYGFRHPGGGALVGTFYDLKQDRNGHPTNMAVVDEDWRSKAEVQPNVQYAQTLAQFCRGGWNDSVLDKFFKGPQALYATQLFIPVIDANLAPASFDLADKVKPRRWIIHYKGKVIPPVDGRFRFVGFGDDVLTVKFAGRVVFDDGFVRPTGVPQPKEIFAYDGLILDGGIDYRGCGAGEWFDVKAGDSYTLDIITGECPGGFSRAYLLLQKEGDEYEKDSKGNPKLPIFKLAPSGPPQGTGEMPVFAKDTPWSIWKGAPQQQTSGSIFGDNL